jgi:hypothetical protein
MYRFASLLSMFMIASFGATFEAAQGSETLRAPGEFTAISDSVKRSVALFTEAAKVLQDPRCQNCHPVTRIPTQGDDRHAHVPFILGGAGDHGVPGLPCSTCHTEQNVATLGEGIESVPGTLHWGLAPAPMAWQGLTTGEICEQLKDPDRNGARSLAQIYSHIMNDSLIAWAWSPGAGRATPPGSLPEFGALLAAWIETGAHCPGS